MNFPTHEEIEDARTNAALDAAADMESCVVCGKPAEDCEHREEYERDNAADVYE